METNTPNASSPKQHDLLIVPEIPCAKRVYNEREEIILLPPAAWEQVKYCDIIKQYDNTYVVRWPNRRKRVPLNDLGPWTLARFLPTPNI